MEEWYKMQIYFRADSRFASSKWEMVLLCNDVSHWLGSSPESAQYLLVHISLKKSTLQGLLWLENQSITFTQYNLLKLEKKINKRQWLGQVMEVQLSCYLAPVPLSIFRSNSKFDENSKHSSVTYTRPITTIFCTRHDSVTVVTCAKYRCDRLSIFETRAFWIFIEFRIRSKYA